MYARRLPITMIFGLDRTVAEGLGDELAEVVARVPVIVARPDAAGLLAGVGARPFIVSRVGQALAVECPHRRGAHLNGAEWALAELGGELFISTAGPHLKATIAAPLWQGLMAADDSREGGGMGYGYGQTEVTGFCLFGGYGGRGAGNAGRPAPVTSARILDAGGRECAIGDAGEICVRGGTVHLGYWNRPEINAERFRGGWWHTTDLGRRDRDGTVTFLGTMTRMIKSGAENIFPAEVENCLEAHPAVKEAAVIGVPSERFGQDVKAVVVLKQGATASAVDLIEHCRRHIASYKKPKTVNGSGNKASASAVTSRIRTRSSG